MEKSMTNIFADAIRSFTVANGVARLELVQLGRASEGDSKLVPHPVTTLVIPVASLTEFSRQLANALQKLPEGLKPQTEKGQQAAEEGLVKF
jgi:hypothetical protein